MNKMLELVNYHYFFDIELCSICNLHCNICPRNKIVREQKFFSFKNIDLLNQWLPRKCNIMFSGMGEPLLYPHLFTAIDKLASQERVIGITTNGQLLNKDMIKQVCTSKLQFLQISINHLKNDNYKQITNFDNTQLLKNVEYIAINKPVGIDFQLSFLDIEMSAEEKHKIETYCKNRGIKKFIKHKHNRGGYLADYQINKKYDCCYLFSQFTFISCDGNILSCCHDLEQKNIIGNINTHSFEEIVESKIKIIKENKWFNQCSLCNDGGRNNIITL